MITNTNDAISATDRLSSLIGGWRKLYVTGSSQELRNKRRRINDLQKFLWSESIVTLHDITWQRIQLFLNRLAESGLSHSTIKQKKASISLFCNYLMKCGIMNHNPALDCRNPMRAPAVMPHFLTDAQVDQVLQYAILIGKGKKVDLYRPILLGLCAGISVHEIRIAKWQWFDFDSRIIRPYRPKVNKYRTISMHPMIAREFLPIQGPPDHYLFYRDDPLQPLSINTWHRRMGWIKYHCRYLRGWHDLRRTCGVRLSKAGVACQKIQKILGHASIITTMKHYGNYMQTEYDSDIEKAF